MTKKKDGSIKTLYSSAVDIETRSGADVGDLGAKSEDVTLAEEP